MRSGSGRSLALVTFSIRSSDRPRIGEKSWPGDQTCPATAPNRHYDLERGGGAAPAAGGGRRRRRGGGRGGCGPWRGAVRGRADRGQRIAGGGGRRAADRLHPAVAEELRHHRVR